MAQKSSISQRAVRTNQYVGSLWGRKSVRRIVTATVCYAILAGIGLLICMPISWMLGAALKGDKETIFTIPPTWIPTTSWHWENFYRSMVIPAYPLWRYTLNTLFLVGANMLGALLSCSVVAYPFARLRFPGQNFLFSVMIATMLIPYPVVLVPQFLLYKTIGWYGTYLPLIVPSFTGGAYLTFLVRQYMRSIPAELDDASRIDGCNYYQTFLRLILPLSGPVLVVVVIFTFLWTWNDFMGPLIYLSRQEQFTLAVGLQYFKEQVGRYLGTQYSIKWNLMMAATLISIFPVLILYFAVQEKLIGGIASVGLKG